MTGLIGGRWTAGNRLEPSRPNGRGRILRLVPSSVVGRQRGGPRPREERVRQGATLLRAGRTLGRDAYTRRTVAQCRARGRPARSGLTRGHGASVRVLRRPVCRGWGVPVAESVLAPPGPIPNPVVTQCSAGEYCGGDPTGGEAAAGTPHPRHGGAGRESQRRDDDGTNEKRPIARSLYVGPVAGWSSGSSLGS